MTRSEINRELEKVYKEMNRWSELNRDPSFKITKEEKERREAFLFLREALYKIMQAKKERNKKEEYYHSAFYYMIKFSEEQSRA
jgi:hypothetical protein